MDTHSKSFRAFDMSSHIKTNMRPWTCKQTGLLVRHFLANSQQPNAANLRGYLLLSTNHCSTLSTFFQVKSEEKFVYRKVKASLKFVYKGQIKVAFCIHFVYNCSHFFQIKVEFCIQSKLFWVIKQWRYVYTCLKSGVKFVY